MILATVLAYISGFSLTIFPLMKRAKLPFKAALKAIWLGEAISIGVMELVMNSVDYHMGGVRSGSILNPQFWEALAFAVPAGYIAGVPHQLLADRQGNEEVSLATKALRFVLMIGVVSLFADMRYEGSRAIVGPYLAQSVASGTAVAVHYFSSGLDE